MWCRKDPTSLPTLVASENGVKPTRKRCPDCNRLLFVRWLECGDGCCWHAALPAHKVPKAKLTKKAGKASRKKCSANKGGRGRMFR